VQALLDRLIFLHIAEDRSVEEYSSLKNTISSIDALVYELYGLSEEEIKIVEDVEKGDIELLNKKSILIY
jgi:hypothetical protein